MLYAKLLSSFYFLTIFFAVSAPVCIPTSYCIFHNIFLQLHMRRLAKQLFHKPAIIMYAMHDCFPTECQLCALLQGIRSSSCQHWAMACCSPMHFNERRLVLYHSQIMVKVLERTCNNNYIVACTKCCKHGKTV